MMGLDCWAKTMVIKAAATMAESFMFGLDGREKRERERGRKGGGKENKWSEWVKGFAFI
jgi:hypothetical protein